MDAILPLARYTKYRFRGVQKEFCFLLQRELKLFNIQINLNRLTVVTASAVDSRVKNDCTCPDGRCQEGRSYAVN